MRVLLIYLFFALTFAHRSMAFEISGYYGFAASDSGEMTLDRGVVESSADTSTFLAFALGRSILMEGLGLIYFITPQRKLSLMHQAVFPSLKTSLGLILICI